MPSSLKYIARRRSLLHEVFDVRRFEQLGKLFVPGRGRNEGFQVIGANAPHQITRPLERTKTRKMSLLKDVRVTLDEFLPFVAVVTDSDCFRKELVSPHSDERSHDVERHVIASFLERFHPREGMRVVAV